jgi:hypothetical protein
MMIRKARGFILTSFELYSAMVQTMCQLKEVEIGSKMAVVQGFWVKPVVGDMQASTNKDG